MNKLLPGILLLSAGFFSSMLLAAPGEWWEITAKMDMQGMPFPMPAQTTKICMPKGGQADPANTQGKDRNCKMTDVKHSGNTVKFKGSCVNQGETMNMEGETSHDDNSFKSNVKMSGKSQGKDMNMAMVSNGKRIGGACDTEEQGKKVKAQLDAGMAAACDTSTFKATNWVSSATLFIGPHPTCPGKKDALCKVLRNDVPNDVQAFQILKQNEGIQGMPSAAAACNVNLASMQKSLCKAKAKSGPLDFLETNCPAEAKAYREAMRKREECEGRGFTSGAKMKQCMGGQMMVDTDGANDSSEKSSKSKADSGSDSSSSGDAGSEAVRQGTKALKGLFGF